MTTPLLALIADVEFALKANLIIGEKLNHRHLGEVIYTEACAYMEQKDGSYDGLYVEHKGEVKELTLTLVERDTPDGRVLRMQEGYPDLLELLDLGKRMIDYDQVTSVDPMITKIKQHLRNI